MMGKVNDSGSGVCLGYMLFFSSDSRKRVDCGGNGNVSEDINVGVTDHDGCWCLGGVLTGGS